jgi:gliding motility-associated-like protein
MRILTTLMLVLGLYSVSTAQLVRGKIVTPAIPAVNPMDPNGDGYITAGFMQPFTQLTPSGYYVPEFEFKMFGFPKAINEPVGDIQTTGLAGIVSNPAPACGGTDLISDVNGYSVYGYLDQNNNLVFRFRVGADVTSYEAWHVLLDTDGLMGIGVDPGAGDDNPGWEVDIMLRKDVNKGVFVYNMDGVYDYCPPPVLTYGFNTNSQKSVADMEACGTADYFYDFYVPFSDLNRVLGVSLNAGLRFAAYTSAVTICMNTSYTTDMAGVDNSVPPMNDIQTMYQGHQTIFTSQCPTPISNLCSTCSGFNSGAAPPTLNLPIRSGEGSIAGITASSLYVHLEVYAQTGGTNDAPVWSITPRETIIVQADVNGSWTALLANILQVNDKIVAKSQYTADGSGCDSQIVSLTTSTVVTPNTAPVAQDQNIITAEDTPIAITLVGTDADAGNVLTYSVVTSPVHGTLSCLNCSNPTYTPDANYHGSDSFTFRVNDGLLNSNTATVSITVTPVNDAPVASNLQVLYQLNTAINFSISGTDVDGDVLTYTIIQPINFPGGALSGLAPNLTFTPDAGALLTNSFTFTINDGTTDSNVATVTLLPDGSNYAPVADNNTVITDEDTPVNITLTGTDVNGDAITFDVATTPAHGILSGTGANLTYTPNADYNGTDSFTFTATDGSLTSPAATITISVVAINDAPIAGDMSVEVNEDSAGDVINLAGSDVDNDPLTYTIIDVPVHGSLSGTGAAVTYTPEKNYVGSDSFTYQVNDGTLESNIGTVSINVIAVNDPPQIQQIQTLFVDEDTTLNFCVGASDPEGDGIVYEVPTIVSGGGNMEVSPDLNFCFVFTPEPNFNGNTFWMLRACDTADPAACSEVTFQIVVNPVNDAPVAVDDNITVQGYVFSETVNIIANDFDIDGDELILNETPIEGPFHGSVTMSQGGSLIYRSEPGYKGLDSVRYQVCDTGEPTLCDTGVVFINVTDAPFHIFEGLSPNNDGFNDSWRINGIEAYEQNRVRVFDRYNNLVFETTNYTNDGNCWRGQANSGMQSGNLPEGTYFYLVEINDGNGPYSGFVVLKKN